MSPRLKHYPAPDAMVFVRPLGEWARVQGYNMATGLISVRMRASGAERKFAPALLTWGCKPRLVAMGGKRC